MRGIIQSKGGGGEVFRVIKKVGDIGRIPDREAKMFYSETCQEMVNVTTDCQWADDNIFRLEFRGQGLGDISHEILFDRMDGDNNILWIEQFPRG